MRPPIVSKDYGKTIGLVWENGLTDSFQIFGYIGKFHPQMILQFQRYRIRDNVTANRHSGVFESARLEKVLW